MSFRVVSILLLGLVIRIGGILYIYLGDPQVVLQDTDSLGFYTNAVYISRTGIYYPNLEVGWTHYVNAVGFLMNIFGESVLLMCGISVLFWFLSALLIDRTLVKLLAGEKERAWAAAIIALLPSGIFYTSIPLREPLQLFGMAAMGYALVSIVLYRQYSALIIAFFGAVVAGTSHIAMLVGSLAALPMLFFYNGLAGAKKIAYGKVALGAISIAVAFTVLYAALEAQSVDVSGGILDSAEKFQQSSLTVEARAQYKSELSTYSGLAMFPMLIVGLIQYLLEPMVWRIRTVGDLAVFAENLLRVGLFVIAIKAFITERKLKKVTIFVFLMMFFALELVWSVGTINWGTASRHHLPAMPFLLVAAFLSQRVFEKRSTDNVDQPQLVYG